MNAFCPSTFAFTDSIPPPPPPPPPSSDAPPESPALSPCSFPFPPSFPSPPFPSPPSSSAFTQRVPAAHAICVTHLSAKCIRCTFPCITHSTSLPPPIIIFAMCPVYLCLCLWCLRSASSGREGRDIAGGMKMAQRGGSNRGVGKTNEKAKEREAQRRTE